MTHRHPSPGTVARVTTLTNKAKSAYQQGRLLHAARLRLQPYLDGAKYLIRNPAGKTVAIHCPEYVAPPQDDRELQIVNRIFASFRQMKEAQRHAPRCYLPSSQWQDYLEKYSLLHAGLESADLNTFHYFLANFGAWKEYHAVESTTIIADNSKSLIRRRYLQNVIFHQQLMSWRRFYNGAKSDSRLSYPTHGNQAGAYVDGTFVGAGSFFNEVYGSLLSGLVNDREAPVVADLGAGYGKLAYFVLRDMERFTFIDFDLPETLCLAAYYLMKTWPSKKALLYGEEAYPSLPLEQYDLIFMPCFEIAALRDSSVDLFMNKHSLGEMTRESVSNYVFHISRASRYFFHMNHEEHPQIFSDESSGMLGYEYPVPEDRFKLLFRFPEIGRLLQRGGRVDRDDTFMYLYERRSGTVTSR